MRNIQKRIVSMIVTLAICITLLPVMPVKEANAATVYITVETFAKNLAKKLELKSIKGSAGSGYVNALIDKGIIKDGDFKSYKSNLTRGDALVLLNRADEYLYGDTLEDKLVQTALEKRISDIKKVKAAKREDVAKAYLKGFMKGYSNGEYSTNRELKVNSKITKSGAISCIDMLLDKSKRAKISPDGQLIRTTKLPKYAKYYPYILASFPNEYYDWKFFYEGIIRSVYNPDTSKWEKVELKNLVDYAAPVDVDKITYFENFSEVKKEVLDTWVDKTRTHLECVFNFDYRTVDDEWVDKLLSTHYTYGFYERQEQIRERMESFVTRAKDNKTIIESSKIEVDGSSLYYYNGNYYLRAYLKYRIVSSDSLYKVDEFYDKNNIIYTNSFMRLSKFEIGKWRECCFDIELTRYSTIQDNNLGVLGVIVDEMWYSEGINK